MSPASSSTPVIRHLAGAAAIEAQDVVAVEEPLEIRVEGHSVAVTMRTPGHDHELAVGFLLTEGVITSAADLLEINQCPSTAGQGGNAVDVLLRRPGSFDVARLTRHVFSASSCGLCGKATIESIHQRFSPLPPSPLLIKRDALLQLPEELAAAQPTFQQTGGLHAAALVNAAGKLLVVREDIGRHNAVDKVLGHLACSEVPPEPAVGLLVSGRISFELVQKALAARLPLIAGVSAPSSLAVEFARANQQTLVGFLRPGRFNVYAGHIDE